jgi:CDP-diacylglycerol--glycerol-3-phosphate 3-phosphatidyltransferase
MANYITLLRIVTLPLLIWFLSRETPLYAFLALVTYVLLALTDLVDGYVARKYAQVTGTGKLLDPVADKLLVLTALLPLIARHDLPAWLGIVVLGRELLINGLRMIAVAQHTIIAAGTWGKVKTVFYNVGLPFVIGSAMFPEPYAEWFRRSGFGIILVGVALALVSARQYFLAFSPSGPPPPPDPTP